MKINCRHHRGADDCALGLGADERCLKGCASREPIQADVPGHYPTIPPVPVAVPRPAPVMGVGTALASILRDLDVPGCEACRARAAEMNLRGVDWCEEHVPTIVGWLRESAATRGIDLPDEAGAVLVNHAIGLARGQAGAGARTAGNGRSTGI